MNPTDDEDLYGDKPAGDAQEEPEAEEQEEPEEQEQTSEEETEPEASESEEETRLQERFRFKSDEDKAVAALAKAKGISLVEAAQQYAALTAPKETEQPNTEARETVSSVKSQIKELEAKAKEAATALNFDEAEDFREQANELRDKLIDLKLAERDAEKMADVKREQEFYAKYQASEQKTLQFYPDAGKAESRLAKEMAALDAQMQELGDPLYFSENKPFILAQQAAVKLGIPMTKPGTAKAAKPTVQHRPMQPASGNARTTTTEATKQLSDVIDGIKTVDEYERLVAGIKP